MRLCPKFAVLAMVWRFYHCYRSINKDNELITTQVVTPISGLTDQTLLIKEVEADGSHLHVTMT